MFIYILILSSAILSAASEENIHLSKTSKGTEAIKAPDPLNPSATAQVSNKIEDVTVRRIASLNQHFHEFYHRNIELNADFLEVGSFSNDKFVRFQNIIVALVCPVENPIPLMMQVEKWERILGTGFIESSSFLEQLKEIKPQHMTDKKIFVDTLTDYEEKSQIKSQENFEGDVYNIIKNTKNMLNLAKNTPIPTLGKITFCSDLNDKMISTLNSVKLQK